ncbi:RNA polymerase sigma-70 factor, ECF subfamily (plasmid) [Ketogulonicigenium robustum]|uniref:RNA polymerase sigma-70 factor, ECF subfamily n=2 Tax=Ketogulonicigenium robustum TaxID=92947 RepID=A0A1W6P386_9RHOB|nr:RNA polymerase sigma-70 factor, ECF subfamily [Ketogulonicigenium robustum]
MRHALRRRGIDAEAAADLTQDAFLRVILAQPSGDAPEHMRRAYLYKVARNLGINHVKRAALAVHVPLDTPEAEAAMPRAPDTETIIATRAELRAVQAALREMPDRHRRAFTLHRIEGWPIARIAREIDLSPSRTWEMIHEAYRMIILKTGDF